MNTLLVVTDMDGQDDFDLLSIDWRTGSSGVKLCCDDRSGEKEYGV